MGGSGWERDRERELKLTATEQAQNRWDSTRCEGWRVLRNEQSFMCGKLVGRRDDGRQQNHTSREQRLSQRLRSTHARCTKSFSVLQANLPDQAMPYVYTCHGLSAKGHVVHSLQTD